MHGLSRATGTSLDSERRRPHTCWPTHVAWRRAAPVEAPLPPLSAFPLLVARPGLCGGASSAPNGPLPVLFHAGEKRSGPRRRAGSPAARVGGSRTRCRYFESRTYRVSEKHVLCLAPGQSNRNQTPCVCGPPNALSDAVVVRCILPSGRYGCTPARAGPGWDWLATRSLVGSVHIYLAFCSPRLCLVQ
jgi:hypothetical protein